MNDEEHTLLVLGLLLLAVALTIAASGYALGMAARTREIRWLRAELTTANDRLYLAWKDEHARIPARAEVQALAEPTPVVDPIPPQLERFVQRYDAEEGKARARQEIFVLRNKGMTDDAIWMELTRRYGDF